jgi:hypothetical protein
MNIINKVTGQLAHITTYDPDTGEITGFDPVGNINLGPISNITIAGGTAGQVLTTDGNGVLSFEDGGGYSNTAANTFLASGQVGDIIPDGNAVFALGNVTNQWRDLWVSNATIYFNSVPLSAIDNTLTFAGEPLLVSGGNSNITTTGTIEVGGITSDGNVVANTGFFFIGDGGLLSNISGTGSYSNADVANYLPTYTGNLDNISSVGNATTVLFGDGANITGLPAGYSNADVSTYLASGTDTAGYVTLGDIEANNILAVNSLTTNVDLAVLGNAQVAGIMDASFFIGDGSNVSNIVGANVTGQVANALVSATVYEAAQPNITSVGTLTSLDSSGNITAEVGAFFVGDGGFLSNIATGTVYSNANVAAYMPTYTGNLGNVADITSSGTITGNGAGLSDIAGANVTGQVSSALFAGQVYNSDQPSITSVGELVSLDVAGNITLGAGGFFIGDGGLLSNISGGGGTYGNGDVAVYLPTYTGNLDNVDSITTTGNITVGAGAFIVADGTYLTNVPGASAEGAFTIETASFSAVAGMRYGVDTSGGAITATLPATPSTGQAIFFADAGGAYATNNLTVAPNGQTIMGTAGDLTVSTTNQNFGLFYNGTTWRTY